jgi:hypothetical protein
MIDFDFKTFITNELVTPTPHSSPLEGEVKDLINEKTTDTSY